MALVFCCRNWNCPHLCLVFTLFGLFLGVRAVSTETGKKLYFNNDGLEPVTRAQLGENLVLTCEAGGMPSPVIYWLYKGRPINQGGARIRDDDVIYERPAQEALLLGSTKSRLAIDCVSQDDVGKYTCVAETPSKKISSTTVLTIVEGMDMLKACVLDSITKVKPPKVYMWTAQRIEYEGNDVQLFCRASDRRDVKITWFDRNGDEITVNDSQYKILDNGDLVISQIDWMQHMGTYKCVAENAGGLDSVSTFLYPTVP